MNDSSATSSSLFCAAVISVRSSVLLWMLNIVRSNPVNRASSRHNSWKASLHIWYNVSKSCDLAILYSKIRDFECATRCALRSRGFVDLAATCANWAAREDAMVINLLVRFIVSRPHPVVNCVVGLREARRDVVVGKWRCRLCGLKNQKIVFSGGKFFPGPRSFKWRQEQV